MLILLFPSMVSAADAASISPPFITTSLPFIPSLAAEIIKLPFSIKRFSPTSNASEPELILKSPSSIDISRSAVIASLPASITNVPPLMVIEPSQSIPSSSLMWILN